MQKSAFNKQDAVSTPVRTTVPSVILNNYLVPPFVTLSPSLQSSNKKAKVHFPLVQSTASGRVV